MDGKSFTRINTPGENHLLSLIPAADRRRVLERCEKVALDIKTVLFEANAPISHLYFPLTGMVSLVMTTPEGDTIEVGIVGNEGVAGTPVALGADTSSSEALIQVTGELLRIKKKDFLRELKRSAALNGAVLRFTNTLMAQISQSLTCNHLHPVEQRICRWLLMTQDRVGAHEMVLTQQFISQMLGVRRPSVTVVAGGLQKAGLIRYTRGRMTILDRKGLEAGACNCYQIVRRTTERLLLS